MFFKSCFKLQVFLGGGGALAPGGSWRASGALVKWFFLGRALDSDCACMVKTHNGPTPIQKRRLILRINEVAVECGDTEWPRHATPVRS